MKNLWEKIKRFFSQIWHGLTIAGRIILGLIIAALIILIAFAISDKNKDQSSSDLAQVYHPSIGEPLAPDIAPEGTTGEVDGTSTTEPSSGTSSDNAPTANPPAVANPNTDFVAPLAGIDESQPIPYSNPDLKFSSTLPAHSRVHEQPDSVKFTSSQGSLYYIVSTNAVGTETLASLEAQLHNSPTASHISHTEFGTAQALQFDAKGYGSGITFIANGKIYYLLGNKQYFSDFKLL